MTDTQQINSMDRERQKLVRHILEYLGGVTVDPDSGKHPLLHAVCQAAIMINLVEDPPDYPDDNDGRAMIGRPR